LSIARVVGVPPDSASAPRPVTTATGAAMRWRGGRRADSRQSRTLLLDRLFGLAGLRSAVAATYSALIRGVIGARSLFRGYSSVRATSARRHPSGKQTQGRHEGCEAWLTPAVSVAVVQSSPTQRW